MLVNKPNIAVLLAVFNGREWLDDQINSILVQSCVDVTIFISNDPSRDESETICNLLAERHENIIVLPNAGKFGGAAKNFFRLIRDADLSDADYIALSDQDDIWQVDKLSHAVKKIQENNVDAYSSNVTAFWPSGKEMLINKAQPQQQWDYMFESAGPGCTFVFTKKLALEIHSFLIANQLRCQKIALHDWLIYAFAKSRGFKWLIDHESHMLYRQHAENVVGANVGIKAKVQRFKKLREGWLFEQALLIADILDYADMKPIQKIKRLSLLDRFWLLSNVRKLRRRLRDCFALAFFMLVFIKK